METMIYLCRAERQGRMIAVAIRPESLYKNECPIEGHPFLPNDKPGILPIHLVGKCERKQGATEKVSYVSVWIENKCSPFQYDFKKLSIVPANETKKRLLKSGKDSLVDISTCYFLRKNNIPALQLIDRQYGVPEVIE